MYNIVIENIEKLVQSDDFECPTLTGFAEACFDHNTEQDLSATLANFDHEAPEKSIDLGDLKEWKISDAEWLESIENALICLINNRING